MEKKTGEPSRARQRCQGSGWDGLPGAQPEAHSCPAGLLVAALQRCRCLVGAGHCSQTNHCWHSEARQASKPFSRLPGHQLSVVGRKHLQIILLLLSQLHGESMALLRWLLSKHRSTCGPGHGEHLQSPCLGISWRDTKKGSRHPGVRDLSVPTVIFNGITLQLEHNLTKTLLVFVREGGRGQAANNVMFLHWLPSWALAGCWSKSFFPGCAQGWYLGVCDRRQRSFTPGTSLQHLKEMLSYTWPSAQWEWEKGPRFLITYFIILLQYCGWLSTWEWLFMQFWFCKLLRDRSL